jgi:hypothetical protein
MARSSVSLRRKDMDKTTIGCGQAKSLQCKNQLL